MQIADMLFPGSQKLQVASTLCPRYFVVLSPKRTFTFVSNDFKMLRFSCIGEMYTLVFVEAV